VPFIPQPFTSAIDLIQTALQLVGVFSPSEAADATTSNNCLKLFNFLLGSFNSNGIMIPYFTKYNFTVNEGKSEYTFSTLLPISEVDVPQSRIIDLRYVNLIQNNVSFPVRVVDRTYLYDQTRVITNQTIPTFVIMEQEIMLTKLIFYPVPGSIYECEMFGKAMLENVNQSDNLSSLPPNYYLFLVYALARMFDDIYGKKKWSEKQEADYSRMLREVQMSNDIDVSVMPTAVMSTSYYNNYYWPYVWPVSGN
jgi:hypothetical protein